MPENSGIPLVFIALIHCVFFSETFYSFKFFHTFAPQNIQREHFRKGCNFWGFWDNKKAKYAESRT